MEIRRSLTRHKEVLAGLAAALVVAMLFAHPGAFASDSFSDVPEGNVHHDSVTAIKDAGVTQGCTASAYCPAEFVRRDQMASFLDRLGALSGQDPVVHAKTAEEAENSNALGGVSDETVLNDIQGLEEQVASLESQLSDANSRISELENAVQVLQEEHNLQLLSE